MKKIMAWIMVLFLLLMNVPMHSLAAETEDSAEELATMIKDTSKAMKDVSGSEEKNILADSTNFPAGNSICDWAVVAWAFSGEEADYDTYLANLEQYVTDCYGTNGCIDERKATETQRIALVVSVLGGNPTSFGKDKDGNAINLVADGTYGFYQLVNLDAGTGASEDGTEATESDEDVAEKKQKDGTGVNEQIQAIGKQGINGYIYALHLLDSNNYEIPAGEAVTREGIVNALLSAQLKEGGFPLGEGGEANIDITAMALQALAEYKEQDEVREAVEKAIAWLGDQMTDYGAFEYYGEASSESSSQVILAMSALGIDITKEERLIKNGMTLLDGLNLFRLDDGSYMHSMTEGTANMMATEQALLALNALKKNTDGEGRLYDLTTYEAPTAEEGVVGQDGISAGVLVMIVVAVVLIVGAVFVARRKK